MKEWVSPKVLEGIQKRLDKALARWNELRQSIPDFDRAEWMGDDEKFHQFLRLSAWAIKFQIDLTELRTDLGFISGQRMW